MVLHEDFQPWEKPWITHLEKYRIFSRVFDIVNQLLTRHSPFAPLGQVDEWTAKPSPFSIQGCLSGCVRIMAAYRQWRSNFPRRERKPKYGEKTDSYVFSGFVYGISRGWEQKSITGRLVTGRFWPCTWKISSVGEDQVNNWEFCTLKITPIVCFCSVSTHFFILSLSANALYDFYSGIVDPLFSFVNKVDFSCQ